ncbi:MAG: 50S ribosomal protein L18 [Acidobacteria bacterium]|nr:50S ribosomal protein L18 [Acidobacteriota bacterium]MBI3280397.1 50S ribosomal protein L18 [Acidobacteriota bacterium]
MIKKESKNQRRLRVHARIRSRLRGTAERPRLAVFRSVAHIYAQLIDDSSGATLVSASSNEKNSSLKGGNVAGARDVGRLIAERALAKGARRVIFDRGGYLYHGRVKALADAAREGGLEF